MKNRRTQRFLIMIATPLLFFLCAFVFFILAPRFYNDWKVHEFLTSLKAIPLPLDSKIIASDSNFGILWGVGNHCDVEVDLLIKSPLEAEEFFTEFSAKNSGTTLVYPYYPTKDSTLNTFTVEEGRITMLGDESASDWEDPASEERLLNFYEKNVENENTDKNYYIIQSWDQTYSGYASWDLRCN